MMKAVLMLTAATAAILLCASRAPPRGSHAPREE